MPSDLRFALAGDREIAVRVLDYLLSTGTAPVALIVGDPTRSSHREALISRLPQLPGEHVISGPELMERGGIEVLESLDLDYVVSIHFPYIVPAEVLRIPRHGWLNLHPSLLPYNRGWHTPTWSILEETPAGATLHFMDEGVDTGDIVAGRSLDHDEGDTADSLYKRILEVEFELFRDTWPDIVRGRIERRRQDPTEGTQHRRSDLLAPQNQRIELSEQVVAGDLLRRLRALTTSELKEAAYYEVEGRRFRVQVVVSEEPGG